MPGDAGDAASTASTWDIVRLVLWELKPFDLPTGSDLQRWLRKALQYVRLSLICALLLTRDACRFVDDLRRRDVLTNQRLGLGFLYCVAMSLCLGCGLGPLAVAASILVAIFTVGLSDNNGQEMSAYSVFNEGCRRLIGHVGPEEMVANLVGGAMGAQARLAGAAAAAPGPPAQQPEELWEDAGEGEPHFAADEPGGEGEGDAAGRRRAKKKGRRTAADREEQRQRRLRQRDGVIRRRRIPGVDVDEVVE